MAITIIKGEQRSFKLKIRDPDTEDPVSLTDATITVYLPDGTTASSAVVSGSAVLGTILVELTEAETGNFSAGAGQDIEVHYVISNLTRIVQFKKALTVLEQLL